MQDSSKDILESAGILGQTSYEIFRRFHSEQKAPLVIVLGSGLSIPAGLPNWEGLAKALDHECERTVNAYNKIGDELFNFRSRLETARKTSDLWLRFKLYKGLIGPANFITVVREALTPDDGAAIPVGYRHILRLKPRGVVTVNLDALAGQALTEARPNDIQTPIYGKEVSRRLDVLQGADPFLVYLHGHIADSSSWILDYDDLQSVQNSVGHQAFLDYMFSYCRVLFYGMSVDDIALSGKLIKSRHEGFRPPSLFWLTTRTEEKLLDWAHENYIRVIVYRATPSHELVLGSFAADCNSHTTTDTIPLPVSQSRVFSSDLALTPAEAASLEPDAIRKFLNDKISSLLSGAEPKDHYDIFREFMRTYSRAIHNSYYFSEESPDAMWFDSGLKFPSLGEGTFGQVFMAEDDGETIAVKIMREAIHNKTDMLGAFRRGVKSMKIITEAGIPGMIKFRSAYEVPPTIIMDYINGTSLEGVVRGGVPMDWLTKVRILKATAEIVRRAHLLPETVLHRDLKPSNVMLRDYAYERSFIPDIVVLDFDMSWYKDSLEKDVLFEARDDFAYLAPEQVNPSKLALSRSTLVDSYGLGMTAFYLFGSAHPQINAYLAPDWPAQIYRAVRRGYEEHWISAPARLARMIEVCTSDHQHGRLDFGQVIAELSNLEAAILDYKQVEDAQLFAEELIAHLVGADRYTSDRHAMRYRFESATGVNLECYCDDRKSTMAFSVTWTDQGTVERRQIRKYVEDAIERSVAIIAASPWKLKKKDPRLGGVSISSEIYLGEAKHRWPDVVGAARDIYRQFNFA